MKKSLLILSIFITTAFYSKGQLINPGFETWTDDALAGYPVKDPNTGNGTTGWWDFNMLNFSLAGGSPVSVFPDSTIVHSGKYSAKVVAVVLSSTSYSYIKSYGIPDTMGVLMSATVTASTSVKVAPGEPFNRRITNYEFYYQYQPNGVDTAWCSVVLTHYSSGARHTIGAGAWKTGVAASSWTLGNVPIFYDSATGNPDTILIVYSSCSTTSKAKPKPGSTLWVDDASVVGVPEINAPVANINVYPNPASTRVNMEVTGSLAYRTDIYDITGQKVGSYSFTNNSLSFSTQGYAAGLYIYKVYDKDGNMLKIGKFSVSGR